MHFLAISKVIEPFSIPPERPSAIVLALGTSIILPALRDSYITGDASDWTPTSLTLGFLFSLIVVFAVQDEVCTPFSYPVNLNARRGFGNDYFRWKPKFLGGISHCLTMVACRGGYYSQR